MVVDYNSGTYKSSIIKLNNWRSPLLNKIKIYLFLIKYCIKIILFAFEGGKMFAINFDYILLNYFFFSSIFNIFFSMLKIDIESLFYKHIIKFIWFYFKFYNSKKHFCTFNISFFEVKKLFAILYSLNIFILFVLNRHPILSFSKNMNFLIPEEKLNLYNCWYSSKENILIVLSVEPDMKIF